MSARQHGVPGEWARVRGTVLSLWPLFLSFTLFGAFLAALFMGHSVGLTGAGFLLSLAGMALAWRKGLRRVQSFFVGARGEERVARILAELPDGWHVYHDFVAGGQHVDHVVAGPSGVFCVETKNWRGRVTVEDKHVIVDGRLPSRSPVRQARSEAAAVRGTVAHAAPDLEVVPVVCFASDAFADEIGAVDDVSIVNASAIVQWLLTLPSIYDANALERLVKLLESGD